MSKRNGIRRASAVLRMAVAFIALISVSLLVPTLLDIKQMITPVSAPWFQKVWSSEAQPVVALLLLPGYIAFFALLYWLQKLFGEFQSGEFFSKKSIKCYLWLVWIQVFMFLYDLVWPPILSLVVEISDGQIALDIVDLVVLMLIAFIAHVLKMAKELQEENQEFI